ncbi:MAG TPA: hypothetical protein VME43_22175 [Bryobacteraceae bacterium]|nr:hypothetical protein [Bryobacteraceae bacterium]
MSDVISEYQKWKQQGQELRTQARQAMEARFRELLAEAARIADEYRADFGTPLKPQPPVTAFRYKTGGKGKARKAAKAAKPEPAVEAAPAKPNPKSAVLEKRLAAAKKKLDDAKAAGKSTRTLEDRIYELEDELRLSAQA